jgi:hypothetical protein
MHDHKSYYQIHSLGNGRKDNILRETSLRSCMEHLPTSPYVYLLSV